MGSARFVGSALLCAMVISLAACAIPGQEAPSSQHVRISGTTTTGAQSDSRNLFLLPVQENEKWIVHVLNRLGYGARPKDVEAVRRMGLANYIELQLSPERIPDPLVEAKLQSLPTLTMSSQELAAVYSRPTPAGKSLSQHGRDLGAEKVATSPTAMPGPSMNRPATILMELSQGKLLRAVYSERQLQEVMEDFWFNHFNVFAHKGADLWFVTSYDRDAIRPHALGRFRDLLGAVAKHPAMLFYLDNWMSSKAGGPDFPRDQNGRQNRGPFAGLNENYARELMELHTLGVDGGYTQEDVSEVARCFTGWSIDRPQQGGGFVFRPRMHDTGEKVVLGVHIPPRGGLQDGEVVLDLLSRHPSTARFIATKLVRRFVADLPPPALVDRAARAFLDTDGDIRAVVRTIITSPEFFSDAAYIAKTKSPLQFVASAVRVVGGEAHSRSSLPAVVGQLGEPLFQAMPPTGYPDTAEAWVNAGSLIGRMDFALALAGSHVSGTWVDLDRLIGSVDRRHPQMVLDRLLSLLLHQDISPETRQALGRQLDAPEMNPRISVGQGNTDAVVLAALILGSPDFQRW